MSQRGRYGRSWCAVGRHTSKAAKVGGLSVQVLLLVACGGPAADPADRQPASTEPTPTASSALATPSEPPTLFGTFDLDEYNELFGVSATTATVEGGRIRYVYDVGEVDADFMVDPNDESKTILQSSFAVSDILADPTAEESEAMEAWFRLTQGRQPEAVAWIREKLDDYLAAPGAEMTLTENFGDTRAGFFTLQPFSFDDPDPLRPASLVGFYVEDRRVFD
ncbi:hypothetical protein [Microbacterium sp.]|uniref:hypothetical protein n=1 Tax=Microbacterium sp. TaxID=51671 RepID=UPI0031FEB572|nr:hypothetical protein [Microbacterium sp.]